MVPDDDKTKTHVTLNSGAAAGAHGFRIMSCYSAFRAATSITSLRGGKSGPLIYHQVRIRGRVKNAPFRRDHYCLLDWPKQLYIYTV